VSDSTLQGQEQELIQNFSGGKLPEGATREEKIQKLNMYREAHQEEVRKLVSNKLPHISEESQKYIREMRTYYRSYDVEYYFMKSDHEVIEEEQHIQEMLKLSGINEFLALKNGEKDIDLPGPTRSSTQTSDLGSAERIFSRQGTMESQFTEPDNEADALLSIEEIGPHRGKDLYVSDSE